MAQAARIFISHAHEDSAWCRAFVQALREAGADVWYDEHNRGDGVIGEEIERELQARPIFIVILSRASLASPLVQREVGAASGLQETAPPKTRSMLLVMAEQVEVPRLWTDFQRVSGPGDGGLSAAEAARRALATLAIAPAHTPEASLVSARSEPAREGKEPRPGPRASYYVPKRVVAVEVLVVGSACIIALLIWSLATTPVSHIFQNVSNLDPLVGSAPMGITTGPDGALWFTESQGNQIGRITTSGQVREFPLPIIGSRPEEITTGQDGALWFTELGDNRIGQITTSGQVREFLTSGAAAGITRGPDGALWFTESQGNQIGRITTSGQVREFPLPAANSGPWGITAGPDGALWFTQGQHIGRITTSGQVREFPVPTVGSGSGGITAGPDGALWFTEYSRGQIGRITTSGQVREFPPSADYSTPQGITAGPDGALWFTDYESNSIGRITTSGDEGEVYVHAPRTSPTNALPWGITTGPDGALWFTEYYGNAIGRITTSGELRDFSLPTAGGASSSTPEGNTAGADKALWLAKYDGNRIGRIMSIGTAPIGSSPPRARSYVSRPKA